MKITHSRIQHGVGQGSFHSASVEVTTATGLHRRFDYVYDCGALVGSAIPRSLTRAIDRMDLAQRAGKGRKAMLDALVLSHFDGDHINGAQELATRFQVGRVFVPYLTPELLLLVVASQAASLSPGQVVAFHALAHGATTLFGSPVTMVRNSPDGDGDAGLQGGEPPPRDAPNANPGTDTRPVSIDVTAGGRPLTNVLRDTDNVLLDAEPGGTALWKLRFWNRGVDDTLLALVFDELASHGFPLWALFDADTDAAAGLADWLAKKANRELTLDAYRQAIRRYLPNWGAEAASDKLPNFLSLALYSGPNAPDHWLIDVSRIDAQDGFPKSPRRVRPLFDSQDDEPFELTLLSGWLGTGDAPLGESAVWADFSAHYAEELPQSRTVLVPHHGAAPIGGPKFYNPALNHLPGVNAVISVGKTNVYGHPRVAVIKEVQAAHGVLQIVTEDTAMGFHEVVVLEA